jgi:hypothetical protein
MQELLQLCLHHNSLFDQQSLTIFFSSLPVTRSHKANDRDHKGLADGTAAPQEYLPKYFAKSGYADVDPKKIKKDGGGKGNWYVLLSLTTSWAAGESMLSM